MALSSRAARPSGVAHAVPIGKIARYDVLGRLGTGGMAEVFVARASGPRDVARHVVVKRLLPHIAEDPRRIEAFVQEARLTSRLSHPNLCAVTDFGEDDGSFYIAMEWVRGRSLREAIARSHARNRAPVPIAMRIVASLASALHHAHSACDDSGRPLGIVHRDVTPENVIVGWNGVPKLLDFGIAKSIVDPQKTEAGVLKGKLAYIPPEQYGGKPVDGRGDVFALGLCAIELLTGEQVYGRDNEMETVAAIVVDPEIPSARAKRADVPEEIDAILRRALAKAPADRWASADEMARAIEGWLAVQNEPVSEREIAAWMAEVFGEEAGAEPALDRTPLEPRRRAVLDTLEALTLGAEADLDAEAIESGRRARRRALIAVMIVMLFGAIAVTVWAVARPRRPVALEME